MSDIIYFAFVPIVILLIIYLTIETMEKAFHRMVFHKMKIYLYGAITCALLIILIVAISLLI
ncbi:hypothetical protein ESOMN_v1c05350 [Williamsoniiplasma somnilux]|uniref:Uncharacterized protein n=1 Tax=Williamsoniiplasma somnilux TaxID=215578 RepID=A0A2K8NYP5_9MOLU|nr:hypothetical protein [Williamsoniiplasma somnilux]ATZ18917.1 hypothetical protein ESOMN_v1c05350 [Williamsoniiplasma somnilux]